MKILESAENYLETILILQKRNGAVRSIDIASELEFTKPSVSIAMKHLRENGYIEMDKQGHITLLPAGREIAEKMYERHTTLSHFLEALGVSPDTAREDACRMEHILSTETFEAIKKQDQLLKEKKYDTVIYPPLEKVPPRFAISKRNEWMIKQADAVIVYINHTYGGAYNSFLVARRNKKRIINVYEDK